MLKNKSAIILLVIAIVCLLSVSVFATESSTENTVHPLIAAKKQYMDGGTYTLKENVEAISCGENKGGAILVTGGSKLTITGGTMHGVACNGENCGKEVCGVAKVLWAHGEGTIVTIEDGKFYNDEIDPDLKHHQDMIYASGGAQIFIKGGEFSAATTGWTLNCADRAGCKITVTGGKFYKFNPATADDTEGGNSDGSKTGVSPDGYDEIIVPEGYKVVQNGEWYEVVVDDDYELQDLIATNETVTLKRDYKLDKLLNINKSVTIDLNGHSITRLTEGDKNPAIFINNTDAILTIKGTGSVSAQGPAIWANNGKAVLKGGTYTSYESNTIYAAVAGHIEIEDGIYKDDSGCFVTNLLDEYRETTSIVVRGGKFENWNPADNAAEGKNTNFVENGYTAYGPDSDGYYKVCKHNLAKTDAKAATYTANGNIEYYTCDVCKDMFKDAAGTQLTNKMEVTIPMLIQVNGGNASVGDVVVDEAIKDSGNSSVVELPTVGNATSVTVPVESLKDVEHEDKGLTVTTKDTTVTLDAKAVEEVAKQAADATSITIEVVKIEEKTLNKEQKEAIKDKEVAIVLSASILADGKEISNFNGGKVKVEIPFTPAEGTNGSDYKVYYIADDGKVEAISTRYVKGKLVVELEHFSEYVVVKEVASAGAPAPAAPAANPNEKDNTPKTGAISVIGLVVAMSVVGLAVLRRKD